MDKKELRTQIRAKKRAMTTAQVEACSEKLAELFRAHPLYKAAKSIYGYMPYNQEVRTIPIMRQAQADGKRVAVPKVFGDEMRFLWLDDLSAVAPGAMLLTTTEVEPLSDVKIGVFSTSSEANVNIILEAATSEDAFFIRTRSSNGCPA